MKIDVFNINDFIKSNNSPEITNSVFFNYDKTPTSDGLFSYELFGLSDLERRSIFGYIDLKGKYIHPLFFMMMSKRMGSLSGLLAGDKYAIIIDKKIVIVPEDYEGAETGISFLYNNFDKINWIEEIEEEELDSIDKKTRLKLFKELSRDEFFVDKWLVVPPFYRSESSENVSMGEEINKIYKELITRTRSLSQGLGIEFFGNRTKFFIQNLLVKAFEETTRPLKGKGSMLRKNLLGKTIDYTASNVITSPPISNSDDVDSMPVKFGYGAFPIATVITLFQPFFLNGLTEFLSNTLRNYVLYSIGEENIKRIDLNQFNSQKAERMIKSFVKSDINRFDPVKFEYVDSNGNDIEVKIPIEEAQKRSDFEDGKSVKRYLTQLDLFYSLATEIAGDKHVYVTRYPVTNFQNIYPSKISLLTTARTKKEVFLKVGDTILNDYFGNKEPYKNYPYVKFEGDPKPKPNTYYNFLNVLMSGNIYLKALGGDYDGDMLYMRGLFTKEANKEAEEKIYSKTNILKIDGNSSRGISKLGKEAIMSLYELTKEGR